jgi:hypothetical protein
MTMPLLHIAIPLMDETENLDMLFGCIRSQKFTDFKVWVCVNQPESFWEDDGKRHICISNQKTLDFLKGVDDIELSVIDRSSRGRGWKGKNTGVGIARKTLMDSIAARADDGCIIVSLDGDTSFGEDYFGSLADNFRRHPAAPAVAVPYYHRLTGNEKADRAILRYEIYMRHYELNLRRIGSPYAFTALGSAIACRVDAYKAVGGMTPKKSGEDFYFLQKIAKYKPLLTTNDEMVFPAARFSDRVFFGTGPAMIKGAGGDWSSYPVYRFELFDRIAGLFMVFGRLYKEDFENDGDEMFGKGWAEPLRKNATSQQAFVRACHHKFDGLRTLQFLKQNQKAYQTTDEENLRDFFAKFYPAQYKLPQDFSFDRSNIETLDEVRNILKSLTSGG